MRTQVPKEELERRLSQFRNEIGSAPCAIHGRQNVRYFTGYDGGGFVPWLLVDDETLGLVYYTADAESVASIPHLNMKMYAFRPEEDHIAALRTAIESQFDSPQSVSADLAMWTWEEASSLGIDLEPCTSTIRKLRSTKSSWELDQLRRAGTVTTQCMSVLEDAISDGASSRELAQLFYASSIEAGAEPSTAIPYISVGRATFENHTSWDWNERAEAYLFEFATNINGYQTPLSRSWTPNPAGQEVLRAIERALERITDYLRPGASPVEAHRIMTSEIEETGHRFNHRAGYSIGLGDTETWMEGRIHRLGPRADYQITEGMAFHVVGSVVAEKHFGVARSRSIAVSGDGCEVLAR